MDIAFLSFKFNFMPVRCDQFLEDDQFIAFGGSAQTFTGCGGLCPDIDLIPGHDPHDGFLWFLWCGWFCRSRLDFRRGLAGFQNHQEISGNKGWLTLVFDFVPVIAVEGLQNDKFFAFPDFTDFFAVFGRISPQYDGSSMNDAAHYFLRRGRRQENTPRAVRTR